MTRKQDSSKATNWKELMAGQEDFLRPLIQEVIQQVLEAEMEEAVGAGKSERTAKRQGYRSGYYGRTLVTPSGQAGVASAPGSRWAVPDRSVRAVSAQ